MYLNNKNININIDNPRTYFDVYELQEDWGIYLATKKRTMKLKCTEFDEEFSEDYAEGTTVRLQISKFDEIQYYSNIIFRFQWITTIPFYIHLGGQVQMNLMFYDF